MAPAAGTLGKIFRAKVSHEARSSVCCLPGIFVDASYSKRGCTQKLLLLFWWYKSKSIYVSANWKKTMKTPIISLSIMGLGSFTNIYYLYIVKVLNKWNKWEQKYLRHPNNKSCRSRYSPKSETRHHVEQNKLQETKT